MKEAFYFSHDYNARNDEKLLMVRAKFNNAEGYGILWFLFESMAESKDGRLNRQAIAPLSLSYGVATNTLSEVVSYCVEIGLFKEQDGLFFSQRMVDHKAFRKELSDAGKRGNAARWAGDRHPNRTPNPKERKGKERKEKEISSPARKEPEDFTTQLKTNPAYKHVDIDRELLKAKTWISARPGRALTKRFFINWINKIDPPISTETERRSSIREWAKKGNDGEGV